MATYLILNLCVISIVVAVLRLRPHIPSKPWLAMTSVLILLTAIFDTIIINLDIVGYNTDRLLGIYIGSAPIEDFFYAVLAAIVVPTLWNKFGGSHARHN